MKMYSEGMAVMVPRYPLSFWSGRPQLGDWWEVGLIICVFEDDNLLVYTGSLENKLIHSDLIRRME